MLVETSLGRVGSVALWMAWRAGDRRAGEALCRCYYPVLVRFFTSKIGEDCDDLVSATFMTLQRREAVYTSDAHFRASLFAIARYTLLAYLRDDARAKRRFEPANDSLVDIMPSMSAKVDADRQRKLLLAALRRLPIDTQIALELHYWEQLSIADIARVLGEPEGTVKSRMKRGRERLELLLTELARTPDELESTRSGLEGWAKRIHREGRGDDREP
jgi:RNA polymerase sigma-70 factor (ECF subfamily)